jgi:hypothetical protein
MYGAALATAIFTALLWVTTGLLVSVGWKVGRRQIDLMDGSLRAARDAASGAKAAADHVRRTERAWIVVQSSGGLGGWPLPTYPVPPFAPLHLSLRWSISNHGKTPAWITKADLRFQVGAWPLPVVPFPVSLVPLHDLPITTVKGHEHIEKLTISEEAEWDGLLGRKLCLVFYGMVYYRDAFGDYHWTRFCETWRIADGEVEQLARTLAFLPIGPTAEWTEHD